MSTEKDGNFSESQKLAADVNRDGKINSIDASGVLSYYAYVSTTSGDVMSIDTFLKK